MARLNFNKWHEVLLIDILEDFRRNYVGKVVEIHTNYKKLPKFQVRFQEDNFPHLLGLHYVSKYRSGGRIVKEIDKGDLTIPSVCRKQRFKEMHLSERIESYPFLHEVFYDHKIQVVIPTEQLRKSENTLQLTCVFTRPEKKGEIVLGLRRDRVDGYFKLTTLYYTTGRNYSLKKSAKVSFMKWL